MEKIENGNNFDEKIKLYKDSLSSIENGRFSNAAFYLSQIGEIDLRDMIIKAEANLCIQRVLDNSTEIIN